MIFIFAAFAVVEYLIYFSGNSHFFQGDTIYYFYLRHSTIGDFLLSFLKLDPAGWYRPLAARTIQSLFYPVFGLEPGGYRVVQYVAFMSAMVATYMLASIVTRRRLAAIAATLFFGVHTVNAYTTYDVAFAPEVIYTFFYVCAVATYLRYRESNQRRFFLISIAFFLASLFSKEAAVTLPVMLVTLDLILNRPRLRDAFAAVRIHAVILFIYLGLVWGYLGVQRAAFQSIVKRPGPEIPYRFALDRTILDNADYALTWTFNLPRGWQTESRHLAGRRLTFLKLFRAAVVILGLALCLRIFVVNQQGPKAQVFRPDRLILAAAAWFFIAVGPALPLFEHFMPHYLFLPLAGFSIAIGAIADAVYRKIAAYSTAAAAMAVGVPLIVLAGICAVAARNDARDNRTLGLSSRLAFNSLTDLKAQHPTLQPDTTIYFSDAGEPDLAWDLSQGQLFKMAYNDDTIRTLYWGWGEVITKGVLQRGPLIVMKYDQFHVRDVTNDFLAASAPPVGYQHRPEYKLDITPAVAQPGEKYSLSIAGLGNGDVTLHYTLNGKPVQAFTAHLDDRSQASFEISDRTEKGVYKFVGFQKPGSADWIQAAASIRIN
ncbi:MAG TPA: glycosyltransferase family 39 protein [Terriglobia bacterium]|nr:glycosyltransferase family 39 protein [Terriglobia bacterium]